MDASPSPDANVRDAAEKRRMIVWVRWGLLAVAAMFYLLHFAHLDADFPNRSPWVDWAKYTDEGWYSDAAVRHALFGHWYLKGDFNPGVALPLWPVLESIWFKVAGVSTYSARTLALLVFGATLIAVYFLIERHTRAHDRVSGPPLAAPLAVLFLCCSPFFYAFERMAIVEPLLLLLTTLAVLVASRLRATRFGVLPRNWKPLMFSLTLGVLLPAMVLTKTTAVFLFPAVLYMVWARAGYRLRRTLQLAWLPCVLGAAVWCVYFFGFVRPRYLEDYRYIFSANAYTTSSTTPFHLVITQTIGSTSWMGVVLYVLAFVALAVTVLWRSRLFANPLVPTLLIWAAGYLAFIGYHFNLQPRYYLLVALPVTMFVAMALDDARFIGRRRTLAAAVVGAYVLAIVVPDAVQQLRFVMHPEYTYRAAAEGIKRMVTGTPDHSHLVLSISGSDLTLMTGLPSIDDDFGTLTLDDRVKQYRPGWFAAWNELDDDKMDAISPFFKPVRVAEYPVMDDPDRNLLILYRLDPPDPEAAKKPHRKYVPRVRRGLSQ